MSGGRIESEDSVEVDETQVGRKPVCYTRSEGMNWNSGRKMKTMACSPGGFNSMMFPELRGKFLTSLVGCIGCVNCNREGT